MKGTITDISRTLGGELNVRLTLPAEHLSAVAQLADSPVRVELKKWRDARSLSANAYAWTLLTKIAQSITPPLDKGEVYIEMLKRYGQGGVISIQKTQADEVTRALDYWERKGEGTVNGKEFVHVMAYIGSSKYDSKEMSVFIDGIVSEAKELGIETMTPQELAQLEGIRA